MSNTPVYDIRPMKKFIEEHNLQTPVPINIGLNKLLDRNNLDGDQKRYMSVIIDGTDVTREIAHLLDKKLSVDGSIIVHGCGMDMSFYLADQIRRTAKLCGEPDMFSEHHSFLGKRERNGEYPYYEQKCEKRESLDVIDIKNNNDNKVQKKDNITRE